MSADGFADKDGVFSIEVRDYTNSRQLGTIHVQGLPPYQAVAIEITNGTDFYPSEAARGAK